MDKPKLKLKEIEELIHKDPDFVHNRKHNNSLKQFLNHNPDGATDRQIANLLKIPLEQIPDVYENIILKLREKFDING